MAKVEHDNSLGARGALESIYPNKEGLAYVIQLIDADLRRNLTTTPHQSEVCLNTSQIPQEWEELTDFNMAQLRCRIESRIYLRGLYSCYDKPFRLSNKQWQLYTTAIIADNGYRGDE